MEFTIAALCAYLLGSLPTSYLMGRLVAGIDLREHGSRNLGATNVLRVLGWKYAIPVLLIDAGKGTVAAVLISRIAGTQPWVPLVIGTVAVVGHVYTVFLRFRGGKGVATAAGVMLGVAPLAVGLCAIIWLVAVVGSGYVSLGSVLAAIAFPVAARIVYPDSLPVLVVGLGLSAVIVYTHRSNIRRLLEGTESRFGHRRKKEA